MWISQKNRERPLREAAAQIGAVTLEGDPAGVYLAGERRNLPVFAPGGYIWRPTLEQEVLVLKTGEKGEESCIAGGRCAGEVQPGEVLLYAGTGGASIRLGNDGSVTITGTQVTVNGISLLPQSLDMGGEG